MSTYSFMDTQCSLTSDDGVVDLGYGAAVAEEGITFAMAGDKNTMTQKQVGKKRFILLTLPHCCSSPKEVRTGTHTGQELRGKS